MAPLFAHLSIHALLSKKTTLLSRSIPQGIVPPPAPAASSNSGWSPSAIIGIVAAIVIILITVPLIAITIRRYERKRCLEMVPETVGSSQSSVREDQSLKSILVTRELQRSSLRMSPSVTRPDEPHGHGRVWSEAEVRGGDRR